MMRPCSKEEALTVLRDRSVLPMLKFYPEDVKDVETYMMNEAALVIIIPQGYAAEVHIACPFRKRAFMKDCFREGLQWLKYRGFSEVFTTAPDERKALVNLLLSLGFTKANDRWTYTWA